MESICYQFAIKWSEGRNACVSDNMAITFDKLVKIRNCLRLYTQKFQFQTSLKLIDLEKKK